MLEIECLGDAFLMVNMNIWMFILPPEVVHKYACVVDIYICMVKKDVVRMYNKEFVIKFNALNEPKCKMFVHI